MAAGGTRNDLPDWVKPDQQFESESTELLRRLDAFLAQQPGANPLQSFEDFARELTLALADAGR
jgi:hypothetical protein